MKRTIASLMLALSAGTAASLLLPQSASANPFYRGGSRSPSVIIVGRDGDRGYGRRDDGHRGYDDRYGRDNYRYRSNRGHRVWVPGYWEHGSRFHSARWVPGHWEYRQVYRR